MKRSRRRRTAGLATTALLVALVPAAERDAEAASPGPLTGPMLASIEGGFGLQAEADDLTRLRAELEAKIDAFHPRMIELNDWMYHNPEPAFLEWDSSRMLAEDLEARGFEVEWNVPGLAEAWPEYDRLRYIGGLDESYEGDPYLPTAFRAKFRGRSESPIIGIVVEYDALRAGFHGCQHNMQGPTGIGAAIALAEVMDENDLPGSVWVIGAPAEEVGPPAKAAMARAGYLEGVDFAFRSHGTSRATTRVPGGFAFRHIVQHRYTFLGEEAHAQHPWGSGGNALSAIILFFNAVDQLRHLSEPQFRFHGIIEEGGEAPNVIPGRTVSLMWVRHLIDETDVGSVSPGEAREMIEAKVEQVHDAARGAAQATGTRVEIERYGTYVPGISVGRLNDVAFEYATEYGGRNPREGAIPGQWEETGMLTLQVPGASIHVGNPDLPPAPGHSRQNADITLSPEGHENLAQTAKTMAATALRLIVDPELAREVTEEHRMWLERYGEVTF